MAVKFYMDVHVPWSITEQLRRRSVDVMTAQEDGTIMRRESIPFMDILWHIHESSQMDVRERSKVRASRLLS